tara:strand:- start:656 stop:1243 length:588 start_codon:yes stop_codon:yes gene_type:complete
MEETMSKTMTKYQLDHFKEKVRRQFNPLIEDQELLVKQFKTQATDSAVQKLSKKMGADKIIAQFKKAEKELENIRATAKTFFQSKATTEEEKNKLNSKFTNDGSRYSAYASEKISLSDCEEQLRDWASNLAEKEIERRPEGARLRQLKDIRQKAIDTVMEAGTPTDLIASLDVISNKIGLNWNRDLTALPTFKSE